MHLKTEVLYYLFEHEIPAVITDLEWRLRWIGTYLTSPKGYEECFNQLETFYKLQAGGPINED